MKLQCTHCGKRLSRKTARQINGVVMCSTCLFKPASERACAHNYITITETTRDIPVPYLFCSKCGDIAQGLSA